MPHYGRTYLRLATKAIKQAEVTLEELVERLRDNGLTDDEILDSVLADFDEGGPVFGNFFSGMEHAGASSIQAAQSQGQSVAHVAEDRALQELLRDIGVADPASFVDEVLDGADPDGAFDIEQITKESRMLTWVAVLRNTCHACLPNHGVTKSAAEWEELDLDPATIHGQHGIINRATGNPNPCYCVLVEDTDAVKELEPLRRIKIEGVSKRTTRNVGSKNLGTSQEAVDKLQESKAGRSALRKLGQINKGDGDE